MSPSVGSVARGKEAGRPDRAGDEAVRPGGLAGDLGGAAIDLDRVLGQAPLVELQPRSLEGIGLEHLGAGVEHRLVDRLDHIGAVEDERLVALALKAAVVLRRQLHRLQRRAHAAVVDNDPLAGRGDDVAVAIAAAH